VSFPGSDVTLRGPRESTFDGTPRTGGLLNLTDKERELEVGLEWTSSIQKHRPRHVVAVERHVVVHPSKTGHGHKL